MMRFQPPVYLFLIVGVFMPSPVPAEPSELIDLARPEGLAAIRVPEGFTVGRAAPEGMIHYPMCASLDDRGRLYVTESSGKDVSGKAMAEHPECRISVLEDKDGDGVFDHSTIFAENLSLPMGVLWHEGSVFVATPPDFVRLRDTDDDGRADEREGIHTGWNVLNTASLHGPFLGPDGWLYLTHGRHGYKIKTKEGETLEGLAPRIWRCRPDGTGLERVCGGGFDNPVELIFTPPGEMILTMTYFTDPQNGQRDALLHLVEGGVYPKPHECVKEFKRTGDFMPVMTKFARIAPAGLMQYRGGAWGREFEGNLYSAQFNPHRIQRHELLREGSTYRTEDSDFLVSTDPDFHPTDVIQDADGSMIVLDTGGWYVDACPLSKISKPDLYGGIYRVRRAGAAHVDDPRGLRLDFDSMPAREAGDWIGDDRPAVRDRAVRRLVALEDEGVKPLSRAARRADLTEVRCEAAWGLMRIGTKDALEELRECLDDDMPEVRAAAAKALGCARDARAFRALSKMARKDSPMVRRAAVESLGAMGGDDAADALLRAAPGATDRFIEHSLIHALIRLGDVKSTKEALGDDNAQTVKCAMIALDQMDGAPLDLSVVAPLLRHENAELRRAALWVASNHPEGAELVSGLLREKLGAAALEETELAPLRESALAFAQSQPVQEIIASRLGESGTDEARRLFLLGIMDESKLAKIPDSWMSALRARLTDPAEPVRAKAISVIRSRALNGMIEDLARIADDAKESPALRLAALGTISKPGGELSPARFDFLVAQLDPASPAPSRLAAAQVIGAAGLSPAQRATLASGVLSRVDAMALAPLLPAFEGTPEAGAALDALNRSDAAPRVLNSEKLDKMAAGLPRDTARLAEPLRARIAAEDEARVTKIKEFESLLNGGDVGRGRQVFFGKKAGCGGCHAIGVEGGRLGPDLTTIGQIRSGRDLLEAIIFPSATFVPGYEAFRIETANDVLAGVIAEQNSENLLLKTGADAEVRLARSSIRAIDPSTVSVMPEGLDAGLDKTEFLDLLAFLQAQNGEQWLLANRRQETKIPLFNGRDLTGFMPWLENSGAGNDPDGVFSVVQSSDGPLLRVSGAQTGYLATKTRARNYRLVVEYKWGDTPPSAHAGASAGILVHADPETDAIWPRSIEAPLPPPEEGAAGKWNTMEVLCDDDGLRITVNGRVTKEQGGVDPMIGRILIQSRNSEMYFKRMDLYPLY